jgi:glycosyltransferase involved in cell wall biosynthesis
MKYLLIIPAYNEAKNLVNLVREIEGKAPSFDYVIINDGSTDNTVEISREHGLNTVHLMNNLGIGGAVQTGYMYALMNDYDIAIQIDGDGQHDPAYLERLIEPILAGKADFTIGTRFIHGKGFQSSGLRRVGINWLNRSIRMAAHVRITDATSGFRAANRGVIRIFAAYYPKDYPEPETIVDVCRHGFRIEEVPVEMRERTFGTSSIRLTKSIYYMLKVSLAVFISGLKKH